MRLLYSLCACVACLVLCVAGGALAQSIEETNEGREPSMFLELGYSAGGASAHPGMRAASSPALLRPDDNPQFDGVPYNDAYMPPGYGGCPEDASGYCVRVNRPGFSFVHGVHGAFGGYFNTRWGLAAHVRYGLGSGPEGTLRNLVVGVRGLYKFTRPRLTGFHASLYVGVMAGQIQVQPRQSPTPPASDIERPWGQTGLGGADLGVKLGYRVMPAFGFFIAPEAYVLFPRMSIGLQATAGIDVAFGNGVRKRSAAQERPEDDLRQRAVETERPETKEPATEDEPPVRRPAPAPKTDEETLEGFVKMPDGRWKAVYPLAFDAHAATLSAESRRELSALAKTMRQRDDVVAIEVVGHADDADSDHVNDALSQRRADAVRDYLVQKERISRQKLQVTSRGAREPDLPHATTDAERAINRRVEIYLNTQ